MDILHIITSLEVGGAQASLYNLLRYERQAPCLSGILRAPRYTHFVRTRGERNHWIPQDERLKLQKKNSKKFFKNPLVLRDLEEIVSKDRPKGDGLHQRTIAYFHSGPFVQKLQSLGIKTEQVRGVVSPYDPLAWIRLARLIKKEKPDIIHTALWSANIMGRLLGAAYKIPVVCDLHGDPTHHGFFRNAIERITLRAPTRFVAVSDSVQRSFLSLFSKKHYLPAKTCMIQNGIDANLLRHDMEKNRLSRKDLGVFETDFVVGSVGRLHEIKNYGLLIRAFALFQERCKNMGQKPRLRQLWLCLVGDGPERSSLESLALELGIQESVLFVGQQDNPHRYYQLFDCFVLSSESEGLSIALLEALSFGLPIITTNQDERHDAIEDGIHGFVVPVGDVTELARAIENLYKNSAMQVSMRKNNREMVKNRFALKTMFQQYDRLYKELV